MLQTALFPTAPIGMNLDEAEKEYRKFTSKGMNVRLVKIKIYETYTNVFYSKEFIENKLKTVYEIIK